MDPVERFTIEDCFNHPTFQKEKEEYEQKLKDNPLLVPRAHPKSKSNHRSSKHRESQDLRHFKITHNIKQQDSSNNVTTPDAERDSAQYKKTVDSERVKIKSSLLKTTDPFDQPKKEVDNTENDHNAFNVESPREIDYFKNDESYLETGNTRGLVTNNHFDFNEVKPDGSDVKGSVEGSMHSKHSKTGPTTYSHFVAANYNFFPASHQQTKVLT